MSNTWTMTQDFPPVASTSTSAEATPMPALTRRAVDACAFGSWFPDFRRVTPKATVIPLEPDFIDYLKADGVFLPNNDDSDGAEGGVNLDPNGSDSDTSDDEDEPSRPHYDFSDLSARIQAVIEEYGSVFPKLNWSSPQDAAWMNAGPPLQCVTPDDVYLLLKASDFIVHDLEHAYSGCEDANEQEVPSGYHLVLKKWFSMPKSHEFRCFVRRKQLIAICQRDPNYYDFLQDRQRQLHFSELLQSFHKAKIQDKFDQEDYVLDVYVTRDEEKVFLIDFNPYAVRTDSLLFTWHELQMLDASSEKPIMRMVESEAQASQAMPRHSHNRYPKDVVGLSEGASIAEFARKWRDALQEAVSDGSKPSHSVAEVPGR